MGGPSAPYTAGFEAAGEIVEIGSAVEDPLPIGTHVVGTGAGAFAQFMTMPASGAHQVPRGWTDAAALGFVLNWATALAALRPLGGIRAGEVVLVHAAAGGVGQAAVRLARHYGARVVAAASPDKHDVLRGLGAHDLVDGRRPDLAAEITRRVGPIDLVLESVGKCTLRASMAVAKPFTGRVVVYGEASGSASVSSRDLIFTHRAQLRGLHIGALASDAPDIYRAVIDELHSLVAHGVYLPGTPTVHPLELGSMMLRRLERGQTAGKHALDPWG